MNDAAAPRPAVGLKAMALQFLLALGLAFGINALWGSRTLWAALGDGAHPALQIAWGTAIGLLFSVPVVTAVLRLPAFTRLREHSIERGQMIDLRGLNPVFISLFAGIGEEILFRGAVQPLLGLWLTSAIFCLLHIQPGQYRAMSAGTIWYAGFVFCVSLLIGEIYSRLGLVTAMAFHATGDLVGLLVLRRMSQSRISGSDTGG